ncbi:hypothetical protein RQP46_005146 [Phenoliferia psychrophenolica]
MAIPALPNELIALIIDHLREDDLWTVEEGQSGRAPLAACCLVSKAFLARARAHLYEKLEIKFRASKEEERGEEGVAEDVSADVVQHSTTSERLFNLSLHPNLAHLVRAVNLDVDFREPDSVDQYAPALALATALRLAPHVTDVSLFTPYGEDSSSYINPLFTTIITFRPPLRRLVMDWPSFPGVAPPSCPQLYPLLHALPHLEVLTLALLHFPPVPTSFALSSHLKMLAFTGATGAGVEAFDAITAHSGPSLEFLVIDGSLKHDLGRFTGLQVCNVSLMLLGDDPATLERDARRMTRKTLSDTLATAAPSLREVEITDHAHTFPANAFDGVFFQSFPRTISQLVMEDVAFEPAAALKLLERRPKEAPRLELLVLPEKLFKDGAEHDFAASFRAAEVRVAFAQDADMTIPSLPSELIALIIGHIADISTSDEKERAERTAPLAACCLVSKTFRAMAIVRLYEEYAVEFLPTEEKLAEGADEDAPAVDNVALTPRSRNVNFTSLNATVSERQPAGVLASALRHAPLVTSITLHTPYEVEVSPYITPLLIVILHFRPPLRSLHLHRPSSIGAEPSEPYLYPLLHSLPLLEVLTISTANFQSIPTNFAAQFRLQDLEFTCAAGRGQAAFDAITASSGPSLTSLTIDGNIKLDLSRFDSLDHVRIHLPYLSDDAASMERHAHRITGETICDTLATATPSLQEVSIFDYNDSFPPNSFDEDFFSSFPRTIKCLFMEELVFEPRAVLQLLERRPKKAPRLEEVIMPRKVYDHSDISARFHRADVAFEWPSCDGTANLRDLQDSATRIGLHLGRHMAVPPLPNELIAIIIGLVASSGRRRVSDENEEPRSERVAPLAACCLVSKTFLAVARGLLYEKLTIDFRAEEGEEQGAAENDDVPADVVLTPWSRKRVHNILANPHLGNLIRRIHLDVDFPDRSSVMAQDGPALVLAAVLRRAPFVTEISLFTPAEPDLPPYVPKILLAIATIRPPLRRLVVDSPPSGGRSPLSYPEIYNLLHVLPHLEDLQLSLIEFSSVPSLFAPQFRLKQLSLTGVTGVAATAFDAITRLSGPSLADLEIDGSVEFDLSRLVSLQGVHISLFRLTKEDSDERDREASHMTGHTISNTLATAAPSVYEVSITDPSHTFPEDAFDDGIFFATFPRTILALRMGGIGFEPTAALRLLEQRPKQGPRLEILDVPDYVYDDPAVCKRFDAAEVWLDFVALLVRQYFILSLCITPY